MNSQQRVVLAIDPGPVYSAYCVVDADTMKPLEFDKVKNETLREYINEFSFEREDRAVIEMIQSFGMAVGKDVFDTLVWVGRFAEQLDERSFQPTAFVLRKEEKLHICGSVKAKDTNIRHALIDRFCSHDFTQGKGTKANPDWFYGFKADVWMAYAVAITHIEAHLMEDLR